MEELPDVVQRFVDRVLPSSSAVPQRFCITQEGRMRFKPGGRWLSFTAWQAYDVRRVDFTWRARFRVVPMVWLSVVDEYADGVGALEARLWGAVRVMSVAGAEVAKGEALRYLAELFWTPFSIVANSNLHWREASVNEAEVRTPVGLEDVAMRLRFDADGDLSTVFAPARPRQVGSETQDTPWRGEANDYVEVGGIRLPRRAAVWWELPEGPFRYWEGRVTGIAFC